MVITLGLAGQLSGPPLKELVGVGLAYQRRTSGRTIVRPSIEGRPRVIPGLTPTLGLAGQLSGPPLKAVQPR